MKRKWLGTVRGKYALGYWVTSITTTMIIVSALIIIAYSLNFYQQQNQALIAINKLEQSVYNLNSDVYQTYVSMTEEGLDRYHELRIATETDYRKSEEILQQEYVREIMDLNRTVESYLETSDQMIEDIRKYTQTHSRSILNQIQQNYNLQQEEYTYVVQCFSSAYSVRLNMLNKAQEEFRKYLRNNIITVTGLILAIAAATAIYETRVMASFSNSIKVLEEGTNAFEQDITGATPITLHSGDEFEVLAEEFNHMQSLIQKQMLALAESAKDKEKIATMEKDNLRMYGKLQKNNLDFLQSRINPHFLFNTLNMINAQARIENADKTADLIETTAIFLRYNLDNITKTVKMRQEIQNLKDYITIQKCRYGDRFHFHLNINEAVYEQAMPCMILQPLVENAISHGVGSMVSGGSVEIFAERIGNRVVLHVMDNGQGMNDEQIEQMYQNLKDNNEFSKHIGIRNIYRRLQLFYNNEVDLKLINKNPGLEIRISVPYEEKKDTQIEKRFA